MDLFHNQISNDNKTLDTNKQYNDDDWLLIINESAQPLNRISNDDYIFEGIAAELDVMNENGRIYTKEEYLKHLPYLQEKIRRGRLFGEIDHPQDYYEVKLKNMSHRIEDLWYDEATNTIKIKIRLLVGLDGGDFAKKLVDLGIPLAISSRAVGKVVDNHPNILRIFTFDLVAEPGFKNAYLNKITENNNYQVITENLDTLKTNSIINKCSIYDNCENLKYNNSLRIYKINDNKVINNLKEIFENKNITKQNNIIDMDQAVFNKFTKRTQEEMDSLKNAILKLNENIEGIQNQLQAPPNINAQDSTQMESQAQAQGQVQGQGQDDVPTTELPNITEDDDEKETIAKLKTYLDFMSSQLTQKEKEYDELKESVTAINKVLPIIGNVLNKTINHENALTRKVNETLNYLDMEITNKLNENTHTTNVQSYLISNLIKMADHLSEKNDTINEHTQVLSSIVDAQGGFLNKLSYALNEEEFSFDAGAQNVSQSQGELVDEDVVQDDVSQSQDDGLGDMSQSQDDDLGDMSQSQDDGLGDMSQSQDDDLGDMSQSQDDGLGDMSQSQDDGLGDGIDDGSDDGSNDISQSQDDGVQNVNENKFDKINNLFESLQNNATKILSKIEESKVDKILENKYTFLKLLSTDNKQKFYALNENLKKEIVVALNNGVYFNEKDVVNIMESIIAAQGQNLPNYLKFIPDEFKPIYENLNQNKRTEIDNLAKSGFYKLNTPYQVKSFWYSLDINESLKQYENNKSLNDYNVESINENNTNQNNQNSSTNNNFVYGQDYINRILNS